MLLLGGTTAVQAVEVATYGSGLKACQAYIDGRQQQNADEVPFIDWLSGYLTGANTASGRTSNILGNADLKGAVYWIGDSCVLHPDSRFAIAAHALLMGATAASSRQSTTAIVYGAGFKSCAAFVEARERQNTDQLIFIDWLGGFLSGVNAMSLNTNNILGNADLTGAVGWLDGYCRAHPVAQFAMAAQVGVGATPRGDYGETTPL